MVGRRSFGDGEERRRNAGTTAGRIGGVVQGMGCRRGILGQQQVSGDGNERKGTVGTGRKWDVFEGMWRIGQILKQRQGGLGI